MRRLGASMRMGRRLVGGGILPCSGSTPTSSSPPARGMVALGGGRHEGADRLRAQPGAALPTWAGWTMTGLGSITGFPTWHVRSASRRWSGLRGCFRPRRVAALYREALEDFDGLTPLRRPRPRETRVVRVRGAAPPRRGPRRVVGQLLDLGIKSKPYLPAIHLMSFYRERFGHRPGNFRSARTSQSARWRSPSSRADGGAVGADAGRGVGHGGSSR